MNCKRSLYVAAILAAAVAVPAIGLSQTASVPTFASPVLAPAPAATPVPAAPRINERVVRTVNDALISTYDLRQQTTWLLITSGVAQTPQNIQALQAQALEELIDEHLKYQELKRRQGMTTATDAEWFAKDAEVDAFLTRMAVQNKLTLEQFLAELKGSGVSAERLRRHYKIDLSWDQYFQAYYGRKLRITPDKVKAVQDKLAEAAVSPRYRLSEIFIDSSRAGSLQAAITFANQMVEDIQRGARFETMARQYSSKPTAATGGDAGWVSATDLPPQAVEVLAQMRAGQMSRPVPVENGVYLYYVSEKSAGGNASVITLKQAGVVLAADASAETAAAAQQLLLALKAKGPTCATLESMAAGMTGIEVGDLGETEVADLSPVFRTAVESLATDKVSDPVRTSAGLHLIAVCGRRVAGVAAPGVDEIENMLYGEELEMLQRRELRNLRAAATISLPL